MMSKIVYKIIFEFTMILWDCILWGINVYKFILNSMSFKHIILIVTFPIHVWMCIMGKRIDRADDD